MQTKKSSDDLSQMEVYDEESGNINVIIDTPKDSHNKYKFDEKLKLFKLSGVLPAGASFPFDFGFVPSTRGEDGDALDVLILMDEPAFVGCLVTARLIGAIEAEQTEDGGEMARNDRLIAVASESRRHEQVRSLEEINDYLLKEIEHFFVSYNAIKGKQFKLLGRSGPERAAELVEKGRRAYAKTRLRRGSH
jgi:inorganic pyrophosphatase